MEHIPKFSEVLYLGIIPRMSQPAIVCIRREVTDIVEIVKTAVHQRNGMDVFLSGSRRDGFGNIASDLDYMIWLTDDHVIWDLNQADQYNTDRCTLILMEYSEGRPGFALLQLLTPTNNPCIRKSCVRINDELYISSAKYREATREIALQKVPPCIPHGPCANLKLGLHEFDIAYCFACKHWPSIATSFILRGQSQGWPPSHVLKDIINSGCHVVPIGFKGSLQEDCEWRISFSVAEQKLVYCMNHTQFVCYGLLKLFLKEVPTLNDSVIKPLLCSYFMKTVLFWVIQKSTLTEWNPSSMLSGFWLCFKFLLSCVYHGFLGQFFNCENNLFSSKIFGHSQQMLYERLLNIYDKGIACLLHCHSIRKCFVFAICNMHYKYIMLLQAESEFRRKADIDFTLNYEIDCGDDFDEMCSTLGYCFTALHSAFSCIKAQNISPWQHASLRKFILSILRHTLDHIYFASNTLHNKGRLRLIYACLKLSELIAGTGCISDRIHFVLFLYSVGKIKNAITNLVKIKTFLGQPYIMNSECVKIQEYIKEVGGQSPWERIRRAVAWNIHLRLPKIKELELEHRVVRASNLYICVPPYVLTHMLFVFCYRDKPYKQQEALYELQILVHYDEGHYISRYLRNISWHILGICQQFCGNYHDALFSYRKSLEQIPTLNIQEATYRRMQDVQYRIKNS